jgi:hypothetical protein
MAHDNGNQPGPVEPQQLLELALSLEANAHALRRLHALLTS